MGGTSRHSIGTVTTVCTAIATTVAHSITIAVVLLTVKPAYVAPLWAEHRPPSASPVQTSVFFV